MEINFIEYKPELLETSKNEVLIGENIDSSTVIKELFRLKSSHFLQNKSDFVEEDKNLLIKYSKNEETFFNNLDDHCFSKIERVLKVTFSSILDKDRVLKKCDDFIKDIKPNGVKASISLIAQELFMNAIFDGPLEAKKKKFKKIHYETGIESMMVLVESHQRLAVFCEDPFGSLNPQIILNRLNDIYSHGSGNATPMDSKGPHGAGLGCSMIYENCSTFFMGVQPEEKTIVGAFVPLNMSYRQREELGKSFHIFYYQNTKK